VWGFKKRPSESAVEPEQPQRNPAQPAAAAGAAPSPGASTSAAAASASAARPPTQPKPAARQVEEGPTVITEDTTIKGNVTSASSLLISGVIEGSVHCGGDVELMAEGSIRGDIVGIDVMVHKGAMVKGNVSGRDVAVGGRVEGQVAASGRLTIAGSGNVIGDVAVRALAVEDGGVLLGKCKMGEAPARAAAR
jgi:cytoskeletal protein CcmA (bactofilin family)